MAYAGDLFIPSVGKNKLATVGASTSMGPSNQLVIAGAFGRFTINNLAAALNDVAGGNDASRVLPQEIRDGIGSLELRDASITLFEADNGYKVETTQFTIGTAADAQAMVVV